MAWEVTIVWCVSSGAGKTTFLNVLSRQNTANLKVSGSVCVNKMDIRNKIKDISAYVQQEDIFVGTLTVKEHLIFQVLKLSCTRTLRVVNAIYVFVVTVRRC